MSFVAFLVPWLFLCGVSSALLALYAITSAGRAARRARGAIEKKAAEGSSEGDDDVVALRGRLRVEGDGCEGKMGDKRKIAAHSFVHSRRRLWPKELQIAGDRERAAELFLDTDKGAFRLDGTIAVEAGSALRFLGYSARDDAGNWYGAQAAVFDGDDVLALGVRSGAALSKATPDAKYRDAATRDVLAAPSDGAIQIAALKSRPQLARLWTHPLLVLAGLAAVVPSCRVANRYEEIEKRCKDLCDTHGQCAMGWGPWSTKDELLKQVVEADFFTCEAVDDATCRRALFCESLGNCTAVDGRCIAATDEDCRYTAHCLIAGQCGAKDGNCRVTADEHCRQTSACDDFGQCTARDGSCVATNNEDCARSHYCGALGYCSLRGSECKAGTRDDCRRSDSCFVLGHCSPRDGECALAADEDCAELSECKERGQCTFVAGEGCRATKDADCLRSRNCAGNRECSASEGACVSDAAPCKASAACRVHGACHGDSYCQVASQKDCEASEGCKTAGACRDLDGRCLESCEKSPDCLASGRCRENDAMCLTSDEGCRATAGCRKYGLCGKGPEPYSCRAVSDEDCKRSAACLENGRCTLHEGRCVATAADCMASRNCQSIGYCAVENGECRQGNQDERCKQSPLCKEIGRCKWGSYKCEVSSNDDCRNSEVCKKYGWCSKIEDRCFITQ